MKRILSLVAILATASFGVAALAAPLPFGSTNIVVYRVGVRGSGLNITNVGNQVFMDEFYTGGSGQIGNDQIRQSIAMPTNWFGGSAPFVAIGTDAAEGQMTLSKDGRFIVATGYAGDLGLTNAYNLGSVSASAAPHVVALVGGNGFIDTTTLQTNNPTATTYDGIRSAASVDGTNLWFSGNVFGLRYTTRGPTNTATQLSTDVLNVRSINIFGSPNPNQLYFDTGATSTTNRLCTAGPGLPTTAGQVYANIPGFLTNSGSPYAFCFVTLGGGPYFNGYDTLYVADDGIYAAQDTGGIVKWSYDGSTWTSNSFLIASKPRGLAASVDGGNVHLYITTAPEAGSGKDGMPGGGYLFRYTDSSGAGNPMTSSGSTVISVADFEYDCDPATLFRGVALAPQNGDLSPTNSGPGRLSVGPLAGFTSSGVTGCTFTATKIYSVANPGTVSINWTASPDSPSWVTVSPSSGTLGGGQSTAVTVSFSAGTGSLGGLGTNTALVTFSNTTAAPDNGGSTTRPVTLYVNQTSLTPLSDFYSGGMPGGPYVPLSQTYTLTSGGGGYAWSVSCSSNFVSIDPTGGVSVAGTSLSGTLGSCTFTNFTISINTNNAKNLPLGKYTDTVSFSNATSLIGTRLVSLTVANNLFFFDDFSTFQPGNAVGQHGWLQLGTTSQNPMQIAGGMLIYQGGLTTYNSQTIYKNFPCTTNPAVFLGMRMTITSAVTNGASYLYSGPSYITTLYQYNDGTVNGGYGNYRFTGLCTDATYTNFVLGARADGQGGAPWIYGTQTFTTGAFVNAIIKTDVNASNVWVYVNPTSSDLNAQTPYISAYGGTNGQSFTADLGFGAIAFSQYGSPTLPSDGAAYQKIAVSTSYADVYNFITPASGTPPTASFGLGSVGVGFPPMTVWFTDSSTGTTPITLYWDFGDNTQATNIEDGTNVQISHPFYTAGVYTVTLMASNAFSPPTSTAVSNRLVWMRTPVETWQVHYYNATNGAAAPGALSASGLTNSDEFAAGFSPTNAAAYPHVIKIVKSSGDMIVTYLGAAGDTTYAGGPGSRTNVLEFATGGNYSNLTVGFFASVTGGTTNLSGGAGTGKVVTVTDTGGATGGTNRYYRIRVIAP